MNQKLMRRPFYVKFIDAFFPQSWFSHGCGYGGNLFVEAMKLFGVYIYYHVADASSWVNGLGFTRSRRLV